MTQVKCTCFLLVLFCTSVHIFKENKGRDTKEETDVSPTLTLELRMVSEHIPYTSSILLYWEAEDPEVILLVTTPDYLEKLASK